jgi:hypothetical protein
VFAEWELSGCLMEDRPVLTVQLADAVECGLVTPQLLNRDVFPPFFEHRFNVTSDGVHAYMEDLSHFTESGLMYEKLLDLISALDKG